MKRALIVLASLAFTIGVGFCILGFQANQNNFGGSFTGGTITSPLLAPAQPNSALCQSAPGYSFAGFTNYGLCLDSGDFAILFPVTGVNRFAIDGNSNRAASGGVIGFASGTLAGTAADTATSRDAAGVTDFGNGIFQNTTGRVKAAAYMSVGTTFTSNAGCTEGTLVGGASAGKFTVGVATACTIIITMGNTATAPNGWNCPAYDQTAVPAVAIRQTASTATTVSLLMTTAVSDVVAFSCTGY